MSQITFVISVVIVERPITQDDANTCNETELDLWAASLPPEQAAGAITSAWLDLQDTPSYVEQQAAAFLAEGV